MPLTDYGQAANSMARLAAAPSNALLGSYNDAKSMGMRQQALDEASRRSDIYEQQQNALMERQQQAQLSEQHKAELMQGVAKLEWMLQSQNIGAILSADPQKASELSQMVGVDLLNVDEPTRKQALEGLHGQLAGMAGIRPPEPPKAAAMPSSVQEYEYAQNNPGFQQYQDRNRVRASSGGGGESQRAPPSGYAWKDDGSLAPITGGPADPANKPEKGPDRQAQQTEIQLAAKFASDSKTFDTVSGQYRRILEVSRKPSAANDYALIYAFAKIQDPTSVVRESEFATAAQTGAYGETVKAAVSKVVNGQTLTEKQRYDFIEAARNAYTAQERQWLNSVAAPYHQQAKEYGLNWKNIWRDYRVAGQGGKPEGPAKKSYQHKSGAKVEILD